jgi:hypothetical protein
MKAYLLSNRVQIIAAFCTALFFSEVVQAQQWAGSPDSLGHIIRRGAVGLGTSSYISDNVLLNLKGENNRPATIRFEHTVPNNFAWDIFPDQNALKFFYSFNGQATQYKASLNSEGIFSINQFESNEWIGQGHRENYLHFHNTTGALGQFTQNPEFFLHANYPANHAGTELGLFIQKNAADASSDIPKIAFGGSQEAAFTFRNVIMLKIICFIVLDFIHGLGLLEKQEPILKFLVQSKMGRRSI